MSAQEEPKVDLAHLLEQLQEKLVVEAIEDAAQQIEWQDIQTSPMAEVIPAEKAKQEFKEQYREILQDQKGQERLQRGIELVVDNLKGLPNEKSCMEELVKGSDEYLKTSIDFFNENMGDAVEKLSKMDISKIDIAGKIKELSEKSPEPTAEELDQLNDERSMAMIMGISNETLKTCYDIAMKFYEEGNMEESLCVLEFLSFLDTYCHEVWLAKGMCNQMLGDMVGALTAYSVASLMNPQNPLTYLHTAECFIIANDKENAESSLRMAEYFKTQENAEWVDAAVAEIKKKM